MKKILYIITIPDWGGAQKYVSDLTFQKNQVNDKIIVATGQSAGFSKISLIDDAKKNKIETKQFKNLVRQVSPITDWRAFWEIRNYIKKEKPDIIDLHSSKAGILGSFAIVWLKYKPEVYYTVHGWVFNEPMPAWKKYLYIFLEWWASKYRDKIIVLGEREKQTALKHKICSKDKIHQKSHILWGGHSIQEKKDALEFLNLPQNKKIIGTVANLFPAKGLNYLIEAVKQINNPNIVFAIIGEGLERKNLELLIEKHKLQDKILLLGEKKDASQYLSAFDLFVLPSIKEGAPFAILEAMQAKLPIIATDVGAIPEMLENYPNKIIIPPANSEKLANAIKKYL